MMQDSKAANAPEKYDWKFPFPLNECYFVGANHEGFQPSKCRRSVKVYQQRSE